MKALKSFPKLSILTVIVALVLSHNLYEASVSAASGGRMGGSSFSSERSPSSSGHHHHYYHHSSGVYSYNSQPSFSGNANQENGSSAAVTFLIVTISLGAASLLVYHNIMEGRMSILQIQVGLSAKAHSLQRELTEIALTADTSTANGWNIVLEETISSLLHHQNCYIYSYSSVTPHWTIGDAEWHFKRLSKEEREKFDVQSLVNINNTKRQRAVVPKADQVNKDCIVVTVLVAAQGAHSLPTIWTTDDMKEALQSMAEICSSKLKAVEVLWSPQDETDSLSVEELLENYPQLRRL